MEKFFFKFMIFCLLFSSYNVFSQVGINTTNPHTSSALDINSTTKGLLIPRIDSAARVGMTGMANSLLVYDTNKRLFFYYQERDAKWYALNAWQAEIIENGGNTDTITTTFSSVGIGTKTPAKKLDVIGDIGATKTITAGQSITAPKIYGEGVTPVGGIIMWSGNPKALPVGWALCDGKNETPNLSGRFIVGYDSADTEYNSTNKVGPVFTDADGSSNGTNTTDAKQVRLTSDQSGLVNHKHEIIDVGHTHNFNYQSPPNSDDLAGGKNQV